MVKPAPRLAAPFTQEATQVRITSLQSRQHYHNLQVTTQVPLVVFVQFFFGMPWILAQDSFMWDAWTRVIARCLFPSCSKTTFKLTLEESMKSLHCSEACWSWSSSITHRLLSSITDHPSSKSTLRCPTASSYKMTFSHHFLEGSTAEAAIQAAESWFWGSPVTKFVRSTQSEWWSVALILLSQLLVKPLPIPVLSPTYTFLMALALEHMF